jgi:phosphoesterase RecJ-like protein
VTKKSTDPRGAAIKLKEAYRVLLTCHRNPDGDAIGSELALAELAEKIGVEAVIVNRDTTPANLMMLPGADQIERSGFEGLTQCPILNIDHHPDNPAYGVVNYLDDDSPAVGEMVWRLFGELGVLPSRDAATNMFTALSTDTGDFRYSNATGRAFRAAAEMVDAGAQPPAVANWVHNNRSLASVRLLGESLRTLRIVCDGKLALITADQEAFQRAEAGPEDTEETVNIPRSIAGVQAVVYFKQWEPEVVRISLRARGAVDVRKIAASFGGGGHPNAAGCTLNGALTEAEEKVAAAVAEALGGSV